MSTSKRKFTSDPTTGFGSNSKESGGRFYKKDGTTNIIKKGVNVLHRYSWYHTMLHLNSWKFLFILALGYIIINFFFAGIYYLIGIKHLQGIHTGSDFNDFLQAFFFSAQTFTTVGYGHISPSGIGASAVATFEAFLGLMGFALASGLFYGRFAKPQAFLKFSDMAVIAPYKGITALMLRTVPYKNNLLMDAEAKLMAAMRLDENGKEANRFYPLELEISKINALVMNWTLVHPLNENSPLYGMTIDDLKKYQTEIMIYIKAFDETFANTVIARTSYTANEIIPGAKFKFMYHPNDEGTSTILNVHQLNEIERVELPALVRLP